MPYALAALPSSSMTTLSPYAGIWASICLERRDNPAASLLVRKEGRL